MTVRSEENEEIGNMIANESRSAGALSKLLVAKHLRRRAKVRL